MGQVNRRGPDGAMGEPQRALRRLRGSRIMPALAAVTLICTFGLAGIMYVAARANATSAAEAHALQDAQVARQLLADTGPSLTLQGGQLVVGTDSSVYILNGETTLVDRAHSLTGNYTSIYQMEGAGLVTIASSLPSGAGGARPLGDALTGAPFAALVGNCGAMDTQTCHQAYSGVLRLRGVDYIVGMQPLFDGSGAFVGALGTAQPLGDVLAPVNQLAAAGTGAGGARQHAGTRGATGERAGTHAGYSGERDGAGTGGAARVCRQHLAGDVAAGRGAGFADGAAVGAAGGGDVGARRHGGGAGAHCLPPAYHAAESRGG